MKTKFFTTLLSLMATICSAQLQKSDTALYLWFDSQYNYKGIFPEKYGEVMPNQAVEISYSLTSIPQVYDGYPLDFKSTRRIPSDTIKTKKVKTKIKVTIDQLSNFIQKNYAANIVGFNGKAYFDKLKHIYILETTPCKRFITVTPVRVDVHIGD